MRIGLLREVVEKLQNGEQVDVEKALGTGDPDKEAMWDEGKLDMVPIASATTVLTFATVLAEIEKDAAIRNQKKQEKSKTPESSTSKPASTTEPPSDAASAQAQSKGQTAYFF